MRRPIETYLQNDWKTYSIFLLSIVAFLYIFRGIYVDDTFITLCYARSLARDAVWGMHPDWVSNAATSPLNVILLTGFIELGVDPLLAPYVYTSVLAVVVFVELLFVSQRLFGTDEWAYAGTLLLFTNPLLVSTMGLETYLFVTLVIACYICFEREAFYLLGAACGLLALTRPDGVLLLAIVLALTLLRRPVDALKILAAAAAVAAPWELVSWSYLGSLLPDTFFIKRMESSWSGFHFPGGILLFFLDYPAATLASFALLPFAPFAGPLIKKGPAGRDLLLILGGTALLHLACYGALSVPPYHWYFGLLCASGVLLGSARLILSYPQRWARMAAVGAVSLFGAAVSARAALTTGEMPIHSNWATARQYEAMAQWINQQPEIELFRVSHEIGTIQFYAKAHAINQFSDRRIIAEQVLTRERPAALQALIELNFKNLKTFEEPAGGHTLGVCERTPGTVMQRWTVRASWKPPSNEWCFVKN